MSEDATKTSIQDDGTKTLKNKKLGLIAYAFLSMAIIEPISMLAGNSSASVAYAGINAPLIPLIGMIFIMFASVPILEYTRFVPFAGGYYGLAELGFGKATGKWVALGYVASEIFGSGILQAAFVPLIPFYAIYAIYGILLPSWLFVLIEVLVLVWAFVTSVTKVSMTFRIIIWVVIAQIILAVGFSLYGLTTVHHLNFKPFSLQPSVGISGLFLGVILSGFLFYSGYGTSLPFSEEGKSRSTLWKAILISLVVTTVVGMLSMYAEVEMIGPTGLASFVSSSNPAITAFYPLLGPIWIFILLGLYIISTMVVATGILGAGARVTYSLGRDSFFTSGRVNEYLSSLSRKTNTPFGAALVIFILDLISTIAITLLMFHFYGYYQGMFYSVFLAGSVFVSMWYFHHIVPDLAMIRAMPKVFKRKLTTPRNLFVSVISPIGGAILFVYAYYEGYSSLTEPYTAGLIFVFIVMGILAVWVAVKHHNKTLGKSFVNEEKLAEYVRNISEK